MPMGVVNDADFDKETANSGVPITGHVTTIPRPGRKEGDVQVPESLRKIIGETSEIEGRKSALELAESLGISPSSVSAYANGATSTATYNTPDTDITTHIKERKTKVVGSALTRLTRAMGALTKDKIATSSAKEISGIAKDMAQVVKLMEPESTDNNQSVRAPQFLVYAPTMIDERKFEYIQAKD
jgi:DNA-binding transcriptional regulator YdaS (Cro superfamily)